MVDRAQEQLLGYLLGALEESEQESVEHELEENPKLLRKLAAVRASLQPLWVAQPDFVPPHDLAARTCDLVSRYPRTRANATHDALRNRTQKAASEAKPLVADVDAGAWGGVSSWLDVAVGAGIVVAMSLLVFPAIQNSRFNSRLAECKDRLRQLGLAVTQYSETHDRYFPPVYDRGKLAGAGIYAPVLMSDGYVDGPECFLCPGSPLARMHPFRVPTLEQMLSASPDELARLRGSMGGSFGYNLGFLENGRYHSTRNLRRPYFALIADAPCIALPGYQSANHDNRGQNVLFEDGRVMFYSVPKPHDRADDVFVNEWGMIDAGMHRNDSVIGASASVPHVHDAARSGTEL